MKDRRRCSNAIRGMAEVRSLRKGERDERDERGEKGERDEKVRKRESEKVIR